MAHMPETESPIEDLFLRAMQRRMAPTAKITPQVEVSTCVGRFRLDFVLDDGLTRIAVECDGAEFHGSEVSRDEWRDAATLGDGVVNLIYRFKGKDLTYRLDDCLMVLGFFHPRLFTTRGLHIIESLASKEVAKQLADQPPYLGEGDITIRYPAPEHGVMSFGKIEMLTPSAKRSQWIRKAHDFMHAGGFSSIAEARARWEWEHPVRRI